MFPCSCMWQPEVGNLPLPLPTLFLRQSVSLKPQRISCLSLSRAGIIGLPHDALFCGALEFQTQFLMLAWLVLTSLQPLGERREGLFRSTALRVHYWISALNRHLKILHSKSTETSF